MIETDSAASAAGVRERPDAGPGLSPTRAVGADHRQPTDRTVDILMVTHNRPTFAHRSLVRLLETCDDDMRVWLWHNEESAETLEVARSFLDHPRVYRFHHSVENTGHKGLWQPINWMLAEGSGAYFSKVDDDCLMPDGWAAVLRKAHEDVPVFGVLGCWRFRPEDFRPAIARSRIVEFPGGHRVLRSSWIEGSGFLMKRACVETCGLLRSGTSFFDYCVKLSAAGWIHGWYFPFLHQEHMDDPRSPLWLPQPENGVNEGPGTVIDTGSARAQQERVQLIRSRGFHVQLASLDGRRYLGWHALVRRSKSRLARAVGRTGQLVVRKKGRR